MSRHINKAELISKVRELAGLTSNEKSALLELLNEKKTYGLVWENHEEAVEEQLREQLPVLHEVPERRLLSEDTDAPNHIIIEAENLCALVALTYTHAGMIDVIYIDPPYNTGNKDFVYNDSYVDNEDSYRHSKWLSFMEKRLRIAKTLLSDKGVIFISIDDNEQAQLRLLCDTIFGSDNFVSNIIWQKNYASKNNSQGIPAATEYLVAYSKFPEWTPNRLPRTAEMDSKYKNLDNDYAPWRSDNPCAPGAISHQGMVYAIQHPFTGELLYPYNGACWRYQQDDLLKIMNGWCKYELKDLNDDEERAKVCGITADEVRKGVKGIVLSESLDDSIRHAEMVLKRGQWPKFYFTKNGKGGIARKTYLTNVEGRLVTSFWPHTEVNHTDGAKKELKEIFDDKIPFDTPKPISLLKRIGEIATDEKSFVLDFFAGSGTTLHAVMELNKDGGHRQCILVTNNENGICEQVTYERNKRVIQGYTTPKGEQVEGLTKNNLRYYKADLISRDPSSKNKCELVKAATDLLCIKEGLYQEVKITCKGKTLRKVYARRFAEGDKEMIIIYEPAVIKYIVEELKEWDKKEFIKIYVFSEGRYAYDDDFKEVLNKVTLCALPDAIYQAYRRVLPRRMKEQLASIDINEDEQAEALTDAEHYSYKEEKGGVA